VLGDRTSNSFGIFLDLSIGEANDSPPFLLKQSLTHPVRFDFLIVVAAINLNDKLLGNTHEVDDEGTDGVFSAKLQPAQLLRSKNAPKQTFRFGLFLPSTARINRSVFRCGLVLCHLLAARVLAPSCRQALPSLSLDPPRGEGEARIQPLKFPKNRFF